MEGAIVGVFNTKAVRTVNAVDGEEREKKVEREMSRRVIYHRIVKRSFINILIRCVLAQFEIFQFSGRINLVGGVEREWKFVTHRTTSRTWHAERLLIVINGVGEIANAEEMTTSRSL